MGAGKTTVGRYLTKKLNYNFIDTDDVIVNKFNIHNGDILGFFEDRKKYLDEETIIIEDLIKQKDIVVATGGGIILKNKNIQLMMENGIVIYLKMSVETQIERIESLEEKSLKKRFLPTIRDNGKKFMEGRYGKSPGKIDLSATRVFRGVQDIYDFLMTDAQKTQVVNSEFPNFSDDFFGEDNKVKIDSEATDIFINDGDTELKQNCMIEINPQKMEYLTKFF